MVIGLAGYKGCGKDAIASWLVKQHGFTKLAFADPLREIMHQMNPIVGDFARNPPMRYRDAVGIYGYDEAKRLYPEMRRLMQELGATARDVIDPYVWIDVLEKHLPPGPVVITDVRYPNEANMIQDIGGVVFRVLRPGTAPDGHSSEAQDFPVGFVVLNDESIPLGQLADLIVRRAQAGV